MLRCKTKGVTVEVVLPKKYKDGKYAVECRYRMLEQGEPKSKYLLDMWIRRRDMEDILKIDAQEIDCQEIHCVTADIKKNIGGLVDYACRKGFFDKYVDRLEYTYQCFERGNELFEEERLSDNE